MESSQRLQVFLSHSGVDSRRAVEEIIAQGRVTVNGVTIREKGSRVKQSDVIMLDGKVLTKESKKHYYALNKPPGYLCSSSDPFGRPLAIDLLPKNIKERIYNIGRLDYQSCGLILFTNDGYFAEKAGHPRSAPEKEYIVDASAPIPKIVCKAFLDGIEVDGVFYIAAEAELTGKKSMRIVLTEGKNREIRRVFSHFHLHADRLCRIRIGPVLLNDLEEGKSRHLTKKELEGFSYGYSN